MQAHAPAYLEPAVLISQAVGSTKYPAYCLLYCSRGEKKSPARHRPPQNKKKINILLINLTVHSIRSQFMFLKGSMMEYKCLINIGYINLGAEAKSERIVTGSTMSPMQGRFLSLLSLHSDTARSPKTPSVQVSSAWGVPLQHSPCWIPQAFQGFLTRERSCGQAEYKPDPS